MLCEHIQSHAFLHLGTVKSELNIGIGTSYMNRFFDIWIILVACSAENCRSTLFVGSERSEDETIRGFSRYMKFFSYEQNNKRLYFVRLYLLEISVKIP